MSLVREALAGAGFLAGLPALLHRPVTADEARRKLAERLERRAERFLKLMERAVFASPRSPYRRLFEAAACGFRDLEDLVRKKGVDDALRSLFRAGVYLTGDEFKGREPVRRGGKEIAFDPALFRNPEARLHIPASTSGSGGGPAAVAVDLAFIRDRAVNFLLTLDARGGAGWRHAVWAVPGYADLMMTLEILAAGETLDRWFTQVDPGARGLHPRYRWSVRGMRAAMRWSGLRPPLGGCVPVGNPRPAVRWLADVLGAGQVPHLVTFVSPALRVCRAAEEDGVSLRGARFTVGGEPLTPARRAVFGRAGVHTVPRYMTAECGYLGYGCLAPGTAGEYHVMADFNALIRAGEAGPGRGLPASAWLVTSLNASAPVICLNVSLGDEADEVPGSCGCPLEALGWRARIRNIGSYEKLTGAGMTFPVRDAIAVLETVLPARFGGSPLDYQLEEIETEGAGAGLRLRVHPRLGSLDEGAVREAFLAALSGGSPALRVMGRQWAAEGFLSVRREAPEATGSGKVPGLRRLRRS